MYARIVFVLSLIWLPTIKGQGCPYSRTVVPGDPKRYIEVVHGVPYERQCAPGTEFSQMTCECSVSAGVQVPHVPWSEGLAFMGGLRNSYPELAHLPLDMLHNELLTLTAQEMLSHPTNPSSFGAPLEINTHAQEDISSLSQKDIQAILDLVINAPPGEITPDLISAIDNMLMLETNQVLEQNNVHTNVPLFEQTKLQGGIPDSILTSIIEASAPKSQQNVVPAPLVHGSGNDHLFSSNTLTDKQKVDFQEIHHLIESFQKQMSSASPQSNSGFQTPKPVHRQIQKQPAIDNFQHIADSFLKAFPPTMHKPAHVQPRIPVNRVEHQPNPMSESASVSIPFPPKRTRPGTVSNNFNPSPVMSRNNPPPQPQSRRKTLFPWPPSQKSEPRRQNQHTEPISRTSFRRRRPPPPPVKTISAPREPIRVKPSPQIRNNIQETKPRILPHPQDDQFKIPSTWKYFGPLDPREQSKHLRKSRPSNVNIPKPPTNRNVQTNDASIHERSDRKQTIQQQATKQTVNKPTLSVKKAPAISVASKTTENETVPDQKIQSTTAAPIKDQTPKPEKEMSATQLLKLIKRKLKQAKKTGNIPFSLLKMLLEKRKMLIKRLKEERASKKIQIKQKAQMMIEKQKKEQNKKRVALTTASTPTIDITTPRAQTVAKKEPSKIPITTTKIPKKEVKVSSAPDSVKQKNEETNKQETVQTTLKTPMAKATVTTIPVQAVDEQVNNEQKADNTKFTSTNVSQKNVFTVRQSFVKSVAPENEQASTDTQHDVVPTDKKDTDKVKTSTNTNASSSFSSGTPNAPLVDISSRQSNRNSQKSKQAVFHYKPEVPSYDQLASMNTGQLELIDMLSQKPLLDLFSTKPFLEAQAQQAKATNANHIPQKSTTKFDLFRSSTVDKSQILEPRSFLDSQVKQPKIAEFNFMPAKGTTKFDLYSNAPIVKSQLLESKLTSPLLKQDLAYLTSILKNNNLPLGNTKLKEEVKVRKLFTPPTVSTQNAYPEVIKKAASPSFGLSNLHFLEKQQAPLLEKPPTSIVDSQTQLMEKIKSPGVVKLTLLEKAQLYKALKRTSNKGIGQLNTGTRNVNAGINASSGISKTRIGNLDTGSRSINTGMSGSNTSAGSSNIGTRSSSIGTRSSNMGTRSSNIGTGNSNAGTGSSTTGKLDLQTVKKDLALMTSTKQQILLKLMNKLSTLQVNAAGKGPGNSQSSTTGNGNHQTTLNNAGNSQRAFSGNGNSQSSLSGTGNMQGTFSGLNNGQNSQMGNGFASNQMSRMSQMLNGQSSSGMMQNPSSSSGMMQMSSSSPYAAMFKSIAAKEGNSDAQEIMQDRLTEMGGGYAMMGSSMMQANMANPEIRSQLASTVFENGQMGFYA